MFRLVPMEIFCIFPYFLQNCIKSCHCKGLRHAWTCPDMSRIDQEMSWLVWTYFTFHHDIALTCSDMFKLPFRHVVHFYMNFTMPWNRLKQVQTCFDKMSYQNASFSIFAWISPCFETGWNKFRHVLIKISYQNASF